MLTRASFAMVSKKTEEECSQELNERMHVLIGHHKDWNHCSMSGFQIALDEMEKF